MSLIKDGIGLIYIVLGIKSSLGYSWIALKPKKNSSLNAIFSSGSCLGCFLTATLARPGVAGFARAKTFALAGFLSKAGEPCPQKFSYVLFENSQATRWFNSKAKKEL